MTRTRLLLYAALLAMLPAAASIVVDAQGRITFSDLETVWRFDAGGRLTIFRAGVGGRHVHELSIEKATVGLKENVALPTTAPSGSTVVAEEYETNVSRVERALGLYFGLGIVAIGAVAGLKGYAGRRRHA